MTIESLISLKQAMKENKGKGFVYEKFQDYFFWYESLADKGVKDKQEFMDIELDYIRYMSKSGESDRKRNG